MKRRRPSILDRPQDSAMRKRSFIHWPMGNLSCNWDMIIMPHERYVREMKKKTRFLNIVIVVLMLIWIPFSLLFWALDGTYGLIMSSGIGGGIMISIGIIVKIFLVMIDRNARNRDTLKEVKVGWGDSTRSQVLNALIDYFDEYHPDYDYTKNLVKGGRTDPGDRYRLPDGNTIKIVQVMVQNQPAGWISIEYYPKNWEKALELQLDLDNFMSERGILMKRKR
ncbi:MAG: hypothetical protein ACMUIG_03820 [Thermoplasmatota archaeon]